MRVRKSWIVAKKDMAEFKTQKYILFTIVFMPLIMGVVIPVSYFLPIQAFALEDGSDPIPRDVHLVSYYNNHSLSYGTYVNSSFENMKISNAVIESSNISNSVLRFVVVNNSNLKDVTLENCAVSNSYIDGLESRAGSVIEDTGIVTEENEEVEQITLQMLNFILFLYVVIPATIPTLIASYSFIGEKTNRNLEPLLATPTTDIELFLGKVLSIFLVTMAATWLSYLASAFLVNWLAYPMLGYYPLPNLLWVIGFLALAPIFCILSISLNVLVSSKVTDVRASQQIGGLIVLPVLVFVFLTFAGPAFSSALMMGVYSLIFLAVSVGVVYFSVKVFKREEILTRWK